MDFGFSQEKHRLILTRRDLLLGLVAAPVALRAQEVSVLSAGYRQMYNLEFDAAHRSFAEWQQRFPLDPLGPISDAAAYVFAELDRLRLLQAEFFVEDQKFFSKRPAADPSVKKAIDAALDRGRSLYQQILNRDSSNPDALFASVMRSGLLADYLSLVEKHDVAALHETALARTTADRLLAIRPDYYDAYAAVGIENYLLSLKPAPLRWILRLNGAQTDREIGLDRLRLVADKGKYLAPFARLLLAVAALRDRNQALAKSYLSNLAREFPGNRLYREELAKLS